MKYLVMVQCTQADYEGMRGKANEISPAWSQEDVQAMYAFMGAINDDLAETGELVDAQGLTAPAHARRIQLASGQPVVTDGPYAETQEVLAGYTIVECDSFDRATEIAAGLVHPDADGEYVDVRPILESVEQLEV